MHLEEKTLKKELDKWMRLEEEQLRQKSRETWLKLGDRNTKFFYSAIKVRQHRNQIKQIINKKRRGYQELLTTA